MNVLQYHLPKTAGRSVGLWLLKNMPKDTVMPTGERLRDEQLVQWFYDLCQIPHPIEVEEDYRAIVGHGAFPQLAQAVGWERWRTVTTVRHPAERLRSLYKYVERRRKLEKMEPQEPFEQWLQSSFRNTCHCLFCLFDAGFEEYRESRHNRNPMTMFYASRGLDENQLTLDEAKRQLELCDIYHMDDVESLVEEISRELGVSTEHYRAVNVHGEGAKATDEERELVASLHPVDMELYEWSRARWER